MPAGQAWSPHRAYRRSPQVSLRPEPFGALAYHFGTRRLSFLKSPRLVAVVEALTDADDVFEALDRAGVPVDRRTSYLHALAQLAQAGTIELREPAGPGRP
jgi:mycofactocin biosynthesis protein MftB